MLFEVVTGVPELLDDGVAVPERFSELEDNELEGDELEDAELEDAELETDELETDELEPDELEDDDVLVTDTVLLFEAVIGDPEVLDTLDDGTE